MGGAAEPHEGSALPQDEASADTEASLGAALPGTIAAASRGGEPAPSASAPADPAAAASPASDAPSSPVHRGAPAPSAPAGPAADALPAPGDPAADALPASAGDAPSLFDDLAADLAPGSLGAIAAEPPAASEAQLREEAFNAAWRFLSRRERTEAEVRARLERNDVEAPLIEEVLDELRTGGYVDDAGYAQRFAEDRRNLDGWGAERIERRLRELGVDRHHIAAALASGDHDELSAATALLARRYPLPPDTPRDREKALGFLVRKGFDLELAHDALRRHAAAAVEQ